METSIDGLFQQIIVFEQAAQKRKNFLGEYKQQVHESQDELKLVQRTCFDLSKAIDQKVNELSNKELQCRSYAIQETIYQEQKAESQQQLKDLVQKKNCAKDDFNQECQMFCETLSSLSSKFGLNTKDRMKQSYKLTDEVELVLEDERKLQNELQKLSEKKGHVDKLREEKQLLQDQLESCSQENKEVKQSLYDILDITLKLDEERHMLTDQPQKGNNFLSLQEDLDEAKRLAAVLEEEILEFQAKLQSTQHKLWQRDFQQKSKARMQQQQHTLQVTQQNKADTHTDLPDSFDDSDMEGMFEEEFTTSELNSSQTSTAEKPSQRNSLFKKE